MVIGIYKRKEGELRKLIILFFFILLFSAGFIAAESAGSESSELSITSNVAGESSIPAAESSADNAATQLETASDEIQIPISEPVSESPPAEEQQETIIEPTTEEESVTTDTQNNQEITEQATETTEQIGGRSSTGAVIESNENTTEIINEPILAPSNKDTNESISESAENTTDVPLIINEIIVNETVQEQEPLPVIIPEASQEANEQSAQLNIELLAPQKITRGDIVVIKAIITNTGFANANDIIIDWEMPNGFEIVSDNNENKAINVIKPSESYESEIQIQTSLSAYLGNNKIKITAYYKK